jgi:hypothetical protein
MLEGKTEQADANTADLNRIRRDLVGPIKTVRRRLRKLTFTGEDPALFEQILDELRNELDALNLEL